MVVCHLRAKCLLPVARHLGARRVATLDHELSRHGYRNGVRVLESRREDPSAEDMRLMAVVVDYPGIDIICDCPFVYCTSTLGSASDDVEIGTISFRASPRTREPRLLDRVRVGDIGFKCYTMEHTTLPSDIDDINVRA